MFVKYINCTGAVLFVSFNVLFMENAFPLTASRVFDFEATSAAGRTRSLKKTLMVKGEGEINCRE
jgi:hypothetical protein